MNCEADLNLAVLVGQILHLNRREHDSEINSKPLIRPFIGLGIATSDHGCARSKACKARSVHEVPRPEIPVTAAELVVCETQSED